MKWKINFLSIFILTIIVVITFSTSKVLSHCDGMDGPVVTAAKEALEKEDVNLVLIWVQKKDEEEIKRAFRKTLLVRKLSPEAKELADMYFFETLVRIHRAGEGAPYTGLKPAGRDLGPAIPAADKAIIDENLGPLFKLLTNKIHDVLHEKFKNLIDKKKFKKDDVEAGRKFVEAYVTFIHYVERLYESAKEEAHGHFAEPKLEVEHKH